MTKSLFVLLIYMCLAKKHHILALQYILCPDWVSNTPFTILTIIASMLSVNLISLTLLHLVEGNWIHEGPFSIIVYTPDR